MRIAAALSVLVLRGVARADDVAKPRFRSHPPARPLPGPASGRWKRGRRGLSIRRRATTRAEGTQEQPWRTMAHGVTKLKPGDTLVLRGGTYYEHVVVELSGTIEQPITIRGLSRASWRSSTAACGSSSTSRPTAWEPCPGGAAGEFRSTKTYPELAKEAGDGPAVFGNFGDSLVPLQAYRFHGDLRSDNPFWNVENKVGGESFVYCGPGVFYDRDNRAHSLPAGPHEALRPGRRQLPRRDRPAEAAAGHCRRRPAAAGAAQVPERAAA